MMKHMLDSLKSLLLTIASNDENNAGEALTDCLIQGTKSKKYIPLLKRQKCGELFFFAEKQVSIMFCCRKLRVSYGTIP